MTQLIEDVLPLDEAISALHCLRPEANEITYGQYYALVNDQSLVRLPRLMAFQSDVNPSGDQPWYRCKIALVPQNNIVYAPWTPTLQRIKTVIEEKTGESWNLAHIIYYKDGQESMGLHSDCMLDLAPASRIAVVSFGVTRQLDLVRKEESTKQGPAKMKIDLPNNSLFLLDEETNKHYVHGIKKDQNQGGDRVSIVFRHVLTYKTDRGVLYGTDLTHSTKQDLVREQKRESIFKAALAFLLAMCAASMFSTNLLRLPVGGVLWLLLNVIIEQVAGAIRAYKDKKTNRRLQELCKWKNFKTWDQSQMRAFLKG